MNEINQLVLDCMAKALRISQTTSADVFVYYLPHVQEITCDGYKLGYANAPKNDRGNPIIDFRPAPNGVDLNSVAQLRALLASLNDLEKELLENGT